MKYFNPLVITLALTLPATGQTSKPAAASTQPLIQADLQLGKLFKSRLAGIQFNPPEGGTMIRQLNTAEIVRFVYNDRSWDLRAKPVPLHVPLQLTAPDNGGLLELTATQLTTSNPTAKIIRQEVVNIDKRPVGIIEARYFAGTDPIFAQQAIFRDTDQHYFLLQMNSPGKPKGDADDAPNPLENQARSAFEQTLQTVQILDRDSVRKEQDARLLNTRQLWVRMDTKKIQAAIVPLHFMRVLHDGKDIGFIQMNEREATHSGNQGVEIIIHSRTQSSLEPQADAAKTDVSALEMPDTTAIKLPGAVGPTGPAITSAKLINLYSSSTYFVTFDRAHEDWTTVTQVDDNVASQQIEEANTNLTIKRMLDPQKLASQLKQAKQGSTQPPVVEVPDYVLSVVPTRGKRVQPGIETKLTWFYLPQALGQILPRALPNDPEQYLFAAYVSSQRQVMARYVDVDTAREVELDGQTVRAVPISDRIGLDGNPTIHYVSRTGEWLGTINEEAKLQVLPTTEEALKELWPGFAVSPEPALPTETPVVKKAPKPIVHDPAAMQP